MTPRLEVDREGSMPADLAANHLSSVPLKVIMQTPAAPALETMQATYSLTPVTGRHTADTIPRWHSNSLLKLAFQVVPVSLDVAKSSGSDVGVKANVFKVELLADAVTKNHFPAKPVTTIDVGAAPGLFSMWMLFFMWRDGFFPARMVLNGSQILSTPVMPAVKHKLLKQSSVML